MKKKLLNLLFITLFAVTISFTAMQSPAQAASKWQPNGNWVTFTRNVKILKIHNVIPRYQSYKVASYTAKKGSHYKLMHWGVDYSWVLNSGKFKTNDRYTYVVSATGTSWFKMGIHKLTTPKPYRSFHGFRIERQNLGDGNTFYDQSEHCVLSSFAPTQKSKVIFTYGSHVYPTKHEWDKVTKNTIYVYRYRHGHWVKTETL